MAYGSHKKGKKKRQTVKLKKLSLIGVVAVLLILVGGAVHLWSDEASEPSSDQEEVEEEKSDETQEARETSGDEQDGESELVRCEYCGTVVDEVASEEDKEDISTYQIDRPVAVSIDNSPDARPQSGISSACVVYEAPVEGGHTRLLGIFSRGYEDNLGPVRSARFYFVTLALEHDALYTHVGGYYKVMNMIDEHNLANIDEFSAGGAFWRSDHRSPPHNAYTTLENVTTAADKRNYKQEGNRENFLNYEELAWDQESSEKVEEIAINYHSNYNQVSYTYNEQDHVYERSVNGSPHLDEQNGERVAPTNVILQYTNSRVIDDEGRLRLDLVGEGEGIYFTEGKQVPIVWEKDDHRSDTRFYHGQTGEALSINPGKTWVNIVPEHINVSID